MADSHFTANEVKFLLAVLSHVEGGTLRFNKQAVADELGMKDAASVTARWNTICRTKINKGGENSTAGEAAGGKKRKVKEENDDAANTTAGDAKKKRAKKAVKPKKEDGLGDLLLSDVPDVRDGDGIKEESFD